MTSRAQPYQGFEGCYQVHPIKCSAGPADTCEHRQSAQATCIMCTRPAKQDSCIRSSHVVTHVMGTSKHAWKPTIAKLPGPNLSCRRHTDARTSAGEKFLKVGPLPGWTPGASRLLLEGIAAIWSSRGQHQTGQSNSAGHAAKGTRMDCHGEAVSHECETDLWTTAAYPAECVRCPSHCMRDPAEQHPLSRTRRCPEAT